MPLLIGDVIYLAKTQAKKYTSMAAYARKIGMEPKTLDAVLHQSIPPTKNLLEALGLYKQIFYFRKRKVPSNRRHGETTEVYAGDYAASVTTNTDPDSGKLCEVFISAHKPGSMIEFLLEDAAVVISVALQYGVPITALAKSVAKVPKLPLTVADLTDINSAKQNRPASIIGAVLKLLAEEDQASPVEGLASATSAVNASINDVGP